MQCISPCLTCQNFQSYCTSCIANYTKIGWKCQININVGFSITLLANLSTVLLKIDLIVIDLLIFVGKSHIEIDAVTFTSFQSGSVVINGYSSVGGVASTTIAATSSMSSGLSSTLSVGGIPLSSSTVVTNGVDISGSN